MRKNNFPRNLRLYLNKINLGNYYFLKNIAHILLILISNYFKIIKISNYKIIFTRF